MKKHDKNNGAGYSPNLKHMPLWQTITKIMSIAFVLLGVLAFSSCAGGGGGGGGLDSIGDKLRSIIDNPEDDHEDSIPLEDSVIVCGKETTKKFISKWSVNSGSVDNTIKLPLVKNGKYNFTVDWGDGSEKSTITTWNSANATHTYVSSREFTVTISGTIEGWQFGEVVVDVNKPNKPNERKEIYNLKEIKSFGPLSLGATDGYQFHDAKNLTITASDAPGLCNTTSLKEAFKGAKAFNQDLSGWNVANVTDMSGMFANINNFDNGGQPLNWDDKVKNVTDMSGMFQATAFNQDISGWDVSKVGNMSNMFSVAKSFNNGEQPLNWDAKVANVTNMKGMFVNAEVFNADISGWTVTGVKNMYAMFYGATAFDQNLDSWQATEVTSTSAPNNPSNPFSDSGCEDMFDSSGMAPPDTRNFYPTFGDGSANPTGCTP